MGDFVRKSTSSWIRPASPTPREGVSDFFIKNRFPPTRPKTYPKHSSQLLLSAENEHSKEGPQKSVNTEKKIVTITKEKGSLFRGWTHVSEQLKVIDPPT